MTAQIDRAFVEAGIGLLMSVIVADGKYSKDEAAWWHAAQQRHPLFKDVPPQTFNTLLQAVKARLTRESWKELVPEWSKHVPAPYRTSMYELAAELAVVDRELEGQEPAVIRAIAAAFEIPTETANKIFMSKINKM